MNAVNNGKRQSVKVSAISHAPPYGINVAVIIKANVDLAKNAIKRNDKYPLPVLARYEGKLYPVDHLDTLEAARAMRMDIITCIVEDTGSLNEVAKLHIHYSKSSTYNPISLMSMVNHIEETGGDLEGLPKELKDIHRINTNLDDGVKKKIDLFMKNMGKRRIEVPSIMHIMHPLSKVDKRKQPEAIDNIINYSTLNNVFIPPDTNMVNTMLNKYMRPSGRKVVIMSEPKDDMSEPNDRGTDDEVDVKLNKKSRDLGIQMVPKQDTVEHKCKCGRKLMINHKNCTIKELVDIESNILAVESGAKMFHLLEVRDADFLELDFSPIIFSYRLGKKKTGDVVILSKRRISRKVRDEILSMINDK